MTSNCPHCGKPVPPESPGGLCPACLMDVGASPGTGRIAPDETSPIDAPSAHPTLETIAGLFPQLEILEFLGRGGMGAVYKVRQTKLGRLAALKVLLPPEGAAGNDRGFVERFEREARALAQLNHPNIVGVYEFGESGGFPFLILEYVDGLNLRQMIRHHRLQPATALKIVPRLCDALQYAHGKGVIHRDIKPENILVDQDGQIKVADFGIAKILRSQGGADTLTRERDVMGTPHYMAPEQVEHPLAVDHRADIYSLGVVFYELLTGELPLGKFAPPSRKVDIDVRLDEVVLHALEKEPRRRYQQANDVKTDVEGITHGSAQGDSPSTPTPIPNRDSALSARRKALLTYGAICCLLGLPAGIVLHIPFVTILSVVGLIVVGLKATGRWPFPSLLDESVRPRRPEGDGEFSEGQMVVLYIGFACCVMGLGMASMPDVSGTFRAFLFLTSLVGLSALVPAIFLRRRILVPKRGPPAPAPARPPRGPLYWVLTLSIGGVALLILLAVLATLVSLAVPALQRYHQNRTRMEDNAAIEMVVPSGGIVSSLPPGVSGWC